MKSIWTMAVTLALSLPVISQAQGTPKPQGATVYFKDGSVVKVTFLEEDIKVTTKYSKNGDLVIPFSDVQKIEFGLHFPPLVEEKLTNSVKKLGSSIHREREKAFQDLLEADIDRFSYFLAKKVTKDGEDAEKKYRVAALLKEIETRRSSAYLATKEFDIIYLREGPPIVGRIKGTSFKVRANKTIGELTLLFFELSAIQEAEAREQKLEVDALLYGSDLDQWLKTDICLNASIRLLVKAEGSVDLWPQAPGRYITLPKGYNTAGKGGKFMAGGLIGRIGEKGEPFFLGDRYDNLPAQEGQLFLQIVPSPWNNASSGKYQVTISTSHEIGR